MLWGQSLHKLDERKGCQKYIINYDHLPPFCSIIDITNTVHYSIASYLSNLPYPLKENKFTVNESFEADKN